MSALTQVKALAGSLCELAVRRRRAIQAALVVLMALAAAWGTWRFVQGRCWQDAEKLWVGLYVAPMYPLALWWPFVMLGDPGPIRVRAVPVDLLAVVLAGSRVFGPFFPASGHVTFLLYSILTTRAAAYRVPAAAFLVFTLAVKAALWKDVLSPVAGGIAAFLLWRLRQRAMGKRN